ncbi:AMP-binding protein [Angustibacter sp. McL0619]|uniref:AMP-binding protein n=1 Tax=Angustibacter sp. McL0619 TaxID=3415676 RepID=UPI003CF277F6
MPVELPRPDQVLDRLASRLEVAGPGPLAVLDPLWPPPIRAAAQAELERAEQAGSLSAGDLVLFTSGATGRARAVVRTVESWRASLDPLTSLTGLGRDDEVWLPLPLTSTLSLYGGLHARAVGARTHRGPALPATATAAHLVPTALERACDQVDRGEPTSLRVVVVAGAPLAPGLRFRAERFGWQVVEYYGAAELSFVGFRSGSGPMTDFPGAQTRLDDAGVLWVRSPYVCRGYLADDGGGALQRQGHWASVGDRARRAGSGWEVLGRGSTAVSTGGHTVLVEEVEGVLASVPGVLDVAVLGLPHPDLGQVVAAVVVTQDVVRRRDLEQVVRGLPAAARPRRWLRAQSVPRTSSGKIRRDQVARQAQDLPPLP